MVGPPHRPGIAALALLNGAAFVPPSASRTSDPSLPGYALHVDDPLGKLAFFAALLAPFAFAPLLLRWRLLLAAPLVAELVLARPWAYPIARIGTHWTAACVAAASLGAAYAVAKHPRAATPVLVCAALCALALNDTVLKPGRWPFVVDRAAYARAAALRDEHRARRRAPARRGRVRRRGGEPERRAGPLRSSRNGLLPGLRQGRARVLRLAGHRRVAARRRAVRRRAGRARYVWCANTMSSTCTALNVPCAIIALISAPLRR